MNTVRFHKYTFSKFFSNLFLTEFAIIICIITKSIKKIGV